MAKITLTPHVEARQVSKDSMLAQLEAAETIGELKLVMMRIIMVMK